MGTFWEAYLGDNPGPVPGAGEPLQGAEAPVVTKQNETRGTCGYCGEEGDDVMIGVCAACAGR